MYCAKCGAKNKDEAGTCVICGTPLVAVSPDTGPQPEPSVPVETVPVEAAPSVEIQVPQTAQTATPRAQATHAVSNHLVFAILTTIFCCLPFGVVSIVFAAQVSTKLQTGDVEGAMKASRLAKIWAWVSFGCGLAVFLFFTLLGIIGAAAENM